MTVVVRRPGPPLDGLVTTITYRTGEQPRTSVEKILHQAHLADEFRELVGVTPAGYLRSRVNGPNHLQFRADDVRS
jgi:hypothetical protein